MFQINLILFSIGLNLFFGFSDCIFGFFFSNCGELCQKQKQLETDFPTHAITITITITRVDIFYISKSKPYQAAAVTQNFETTTFN